MDQIWTFDCEWAPDIVAGRRLYHIPPDVPDDEVLRVMGKGRKERVVPLLGTAREALATYVDAWRPVLARGGRPRRS